MKITLWLYLTVLIVSGCGKEQDPPEKEEIIVKNFNVIIAPDLSNRINPEVHPKPVHDTAVINRIYESIDNKLLKIGGRQSSQEDIVNIDFINRGSLSSSDIDAKRFIIDFSRFGTNQLDRSEYIRHSLKRDIHRAKSEVKKLYDFSLQNQAGSDIYNYLNSTINNVLVERQIKEIALTKTTTEFVSTDNIVIIFTDGYIENVTEDNGYKLSQSSVNAIRSDFKRSGQTDINAFIKESKYRINPLTNKSLENVKIIVVEMLDRSLDKNGAATVHPTDFVIMRAVWEEWFDSSHVREYEFVESQNTSEQVIERVLKFIKRTSEPEDRSNSYK